MSELESKAVEMLDKLEAITVNYAPDVADAALSAIQITAINDIVRSVLAGVFVVVLFFASKAAFLYCLKKKYEAGKYNDWEYGVFFSIAVPLIPIVILSINAITGLADVWVWTALIEPKLALAHKITGL